MICNDHIFRSVSRRLLTDALILIGIRPYSAPESQKKNSQTSKSSKMKQILVTPPDKTIFVQDALMEHGIIAKYLSGDVAGFVHLSNGNFRLCTIISNSNDSVAPTFIDLADLILNYPDLKFYQL